MADSALRAFLHAEPGERTLFLRAAVALPVVQIALRALGYPRLLRWLGGGRKPLPPASAIPALLASRHKSVERAGRRLPWKTTCLERSLTLWWLLRRTGVPCELRIGVRRGETGVEAHAWVEHAGQAINDTPDVAARYSAFEAPVG